MIGLSIESRIKSCCTTNNTSNSLLQIQDAEKTKYQEEVNLETQQQDIIQMELETNIKRPGLGLVVMKIVPIFPGQDLYLFMDLKIS